MPKSDLEIRAFAHRAVRRRLAADDAGRAHALREYMAVSMPNVAEDEAVRLADMVPPLLGELYARWTDMFVDRLLETVPREALDALCSGREEDEAALALAYGLSGLAMLLGLAFSPNLELKTCLHCDRRVLAEMFVAASCALALFMAVVVASIPKI